MCEIQSQCVNIGNGQFINNFTAMSNKNIAIPKYKWESTQQMKQPLSPATYKNDPKVFVQYSPKNLPTQSPKYFKTGAINRHYSQEQFKRFSHPNQHNLEHNTISVEEQYQSNHHKMVHDSNRTTQSSQSYTQPYNYSSRSYIKEPSQTTISDHNPNKRVSPSSSSSPAFFKSKPKQPTKENYQIPRMTRDNFSFLDKLGQGKFGKVYLVRQRNTGFVMAMKVLEKKKIWQDNILQQFIRQLKIQAFLNHPNIIDVYGFFHDEINFYTLLQLGCDGQLYNIIAQHKNLTEQATSFITKNLLQAVNCMHQNQILHRDIKPENIVLIMGNVKLCDFGWAVNKVKKEELRSTFCGTPLYLSPQLLKGQRYDEKVDLWAIGILAYELFIGCSPFQINQQQDLIKILTEQVKFPKNKKISSEFQQFIQHILNKNPKQRLPSHDLLRLPFIRKYQQFETCQQLCG